jgi:hypothetical protein
MSLIIKPGGGVLYMKVGTHAQETLEDIIARKTKEIEDAGVAFWGYGGNTCHPQSIVQPFAKTYEERGQKIYLVMQRMDSKHRAEPIRAEKYSVDGLTWKEIPQAINVKGSRYALVIKNLHPEEFDLPLDRTKVALGTSMGAVGSKYISGRVDKACFELTDEVLGKTGPNEVVHINLVAELVDPYAVYVK